MKRYIAFLRGINISGKNKVPMAELRQGFERLNYTEVKTYLNSGNVIFSSDEADTLKTTSRIEEMVENQFSLDIPVFVISKEELDILTLSGLLHDIGKMMVPDNIIQKRKFMII